ncbi:MAG: RNA methyltransferase [Myxococcales bacterium]|nr:RNA methyltransferase [Myxococcales bacterium]
MRDVSIGLVHYPVLDGRREIVTTAVTNLDVHDLARSARTYGCRRYFVVHPIEAQRQLVGRIVDHWTHGSSAKRIPDRKEALSIVETVPSLEATYAAMGGRDAIEVWITAARDLDRRRTLAEARAELAQDGKPVLILFGTGWGLAASVVDAADAILAPVRGPTSYNHLSVRAACAIVLDRLLAPEA